MKELIEMRTFLRRLNSFGEGVSSRVDWNEEIYEKLNS